MEERLNSPEARRAPRLAVLAAGLLLLGGTASGQGLPRGAEKAPDAARPFLGAWDVEKLGAPRKCTITLGAEPVGNGWQLRFPATCRRALPILGDVAAWSLSPEGFPRLTDASGKAVIVFHEKIDAGRRGRGSDGAQYGLDPKGYVRAAARPVPSQAELAATAANQRTAVDLARTPAAEAVPGRYAVMRQPGREVCKMALTTAPASAVGAAVASFDGLCPDTGLTIFSPIAWRYEAGRLELIARKGHKVELVFEGGQWRKDPAVGAPLLLRKLP